MGNFASIVILIFCIQQIFAQPIIHTGYVYESDNRGYLNTAELIFYNSNGEILDTCYTNVEGYFQISLPEFDEYEIQVQKNMFEPKIIKVLNTTSDEKKTIFSKIEMVRSPGYIFEITLANKTYDNQEAVDALNGTRIEVYNNTTHKAEMVLLDYLEPEFKVSLFKGNHYTILIRKQEYLAKRMEAFVDVDGCILCFEGLGTIEPGVSDNLSEGNQIGVLLANVELERIFKGKKVTINNLYYDVAKWNLTEQSKEELDKVVILMADNQNAKVELGSHTDSRGSVNDNLKLSLKRAKKAVDYLVNMGVDSERIFGRGYGESELINNCTDSTECSEIDHLKNRRTELKILSLADSHTEMKSLFQLKKEERTKDLLEEIESSDQIRIPDDSSLYEEKIELQSVEINKEEEVDKITEDLESYTSKISKIVIKKSFVPLINEHSLYTRHPDLLEIKHSDDNYYYLIGHFDTEEEGKLFLKQTILLSYPEAYLVQVYDGKMIKK